MVLIVCLFICALIALFFLWYKFKFPKLNSVSIITGAPKTGKSTFAVAYAIHLKKVAVLKTKFKNFWRVLFNKPKKPLPLLYSNIPLKVPYVPITKELLLRKERFVYGSIIYIGEYSLVADSQLIKDMELNEALLLLNKLIGHETRGGKMVIDTQCINDCHYSVKRVVSEYLYIHHLIKWIPFILVACVQECRYSDDNSTVQIQQGDIENDLKWVILPRSVWRKFDAYAYECLTRDLPVNDRVCVAKNLDADDIVSFRNFKNLGGGSSVKKETK